MFHPNTLHKGILARGISVSLGLLLVPLTLIPTGVDENLACGSEVPDSNCVKFTGTLCWNEGEYIQNWRTVK